MPDSYAREMLKWFLAWLPMIAIAIANGAARDLWYGPSLGDLRAHQVSTVMAIGLFGLYIWLALRLLRPISTLNALVGGAIWFGMTVAFEFLFGHYVVGDSWSQLAENYNLLSGHLWPIIPLWIFVAPPLFCKFQR